MRSINSAGLGVAIVLGLALASGTASAAGQLALFSGLGLGTAASGETCATGLCPDSDSCDCVPVSGTGKVSELGDITFASTVVLDGTDSVGICVQAFGTLVLTSTAKSKTTNALSLDYIGIVCETASENAFLLNGTYFVDGSNSTGKFAGATGSGQVIGADSGGAITGDLNGTLLP